MRLIISKNGKSVNRNTGVNEVYIDECERTLKFIFE